MSITSIEHRITVNTAVCKVCTKGFNPRGLVQADRLKSVGVCFDCDFWVEKVTIRDDDDVVRINGNHYIVGSQLDNYEVDASDSLESIVNKWKPNKNFKGMGGSKIVIKLNNGRVIITNDLWHQGKIPARFANILPNNAVMESIS